MQKKVTQPMKDALLAIAAAMPLVGDQSLAMLPCHGRTANALEDRGLIKWRAVNTAEGVRWSLTGNGWSAVTRIEEAGRGCVCGMPGTSGSAHEDGCPRAYGAQTPGTLPTLEAERENTDKILKGVAKVLRERDAVEVMETGGRYYLRCLTCMDETLYLYPTEDLDAVKGKFAANHPCQPIEAAHTEALLIDARMNMPTAADFPDLMESLPKPNGNTVIITGARVHVEGVPCDRVYDDETINGVDTDAEATCPGCLSQPTELVAGDGSVIKVGSRVVVAAEATIDGVETTGVVERLGDYENGEWDLTVMVRHNDDRKPWGHDAASLSATRIMVPMCLRCDINEHDQCRRIVVPSLISARVIYCQCPVCHPAEGAPSMAAASVALGSLLSGLKPPAESKSTEKEIGHPYRVPSHMDVVPSGTGRGDGWIVRCDSCDYSDTIHTKRAACLDAQEHVCSSPNRDAWRSETLRPYTENLMLHLDLAACETFGIMGMNWQGAEMMGRTEEWCGHALEALARIEATEVTVVRVAESEAAAVAWLRAEAAKIDAGRKPLRRRKPSKAARRNRR